MTTPATITQEEDAPVAEEMPTVGARALFSDTLEIRSSEADEQQGILGRLTGNLAVFDEWTEIDSAIEGHFMERVAFGAFKKTFKEGHGRIRCIFHHGNDPSVGVRVLGPVDVLEERPDGAWAEVPLLDTSYNRDLAPGIKAGLYGMSFRFRVVRQDVVRRPRPSEHNPKGIPERTLTELAVPEFGPTPFQAYAGATAGMRSLTDELYLGRLASDPRKLHALVERSGISVPKLWDEEVAPALELSIEQEVECPDCGAENDDDATYCDQCGGELETAAAPDTEEAHREPSVTLRGRSAASRPSGTRVVTERLFQRSVHFAASHAWEMEPAMLSIVFGIIQERAAGVRLSQDEIQARLGIRAADPADTPATPSKSPVAVIKVSGPIVPRGDMVNNVSAPDMTSVTGLQKQFRTALADPDIKSILFDVDSPGGSSMMIPELTKEIFDARGQKPIVAVANTFMASAALHLMCSCDEIYASPSAEVGSLGVYAAHQDLTKALEAQGKKITMVHAQDAPFKTEFQPFVELSDDAKAELQRRVDDVMTEFVDSVAAGRGTTVDDVKANYGQGRMLSAADALKVGMIDGIETFDSVLGRMLADAQQPEEDTSTSTAPASAAPTTEGHPANARRGIVIDPKTLRPKEEPQWRL